MIISELKKEIEEQRKRNLELFNSIPVPTHEDPLNEKAEPILKEWREGSKKVKLLIKQLHELERLEKERNKTVKTDDNINTFINGFGEATQRNITSQTYERTDKRLQKEILSFIGVKQNV